MRIALRETAKEKQKRLVRLRMALVNLKIF